METINALPENKPQMVLGQFIDPMVNADRAEETTEGQTWIKGVGQPFTKLLGPDPLLKLGGYHQAIADSLGGGINFDAQIAVLKGAEHGDRSYKGRQGLPFQYAKASRFRPISG